jgi:hypothetical protein
MNVKILSLPVIGVLLFISISAISSESKEIDLSKVISKEEFSLYKDVGEFIDNSPKVTILVKPDPKDIAEYGTDVVRSLTGSDCDRDGKMDNNAICNAVYYKLWMQYER